MSISYVFQVLLFQMIFYLAFYLLLKKHSFHRTNRYILVAAFLISFVLPFMKFDIFPVGDSADVVIKLPEIYLTEAANNLATTSTTQDLDAVKPTSYNFLGIIWLVGVLITSALFVIRVITLFRISKNSKKLVSHGHTYYSVSDTYSAFSFLSFIFIGDKIHQDDVPQILEHECVHVQEKHSIDILIFELIKIPFWFNPFVYLLQRELILVHEFEADAGISSKFGTTNYYLNLLSQTFEVPKTVLINSFSKKSILKKRIDMLQKDKSSKNALWNYLVIIPIIGAMILYVSCEAYDYDSELNLDKYSYELRKGGEMTPEIEKIHKEFEAFLFGNPDYVAWGLIDENSGKISYSVHKATEAVPEGLTKLTVSGNTSSYNIYINLPETTFNSQQSINQNVAVPFSVIENPPLFAGCDPNLSREEGTICTRDKISEFVGGNFNTALAKELGLTGRMRINVIFKISSDGSVKDVRSRAPLPELEEEAIRVISSMPKFTPGEQKGMKVDVPYSLPIVFQVDE